MFGFSLGGSASKSKSSTYIDPKTSKAQWGNYEQAQQIAPNYTPTSAGLIGQYMNPYEDSAIQASLGDLDRFRQMAVSQTGDAAQSAGAFGGSRHGVAESLTNADFGRQAGLLSANMRAQGFNTALGAAQQENALSYQYPLERAGLLTSIIGKVTPKVYGKGSNMSFSGEVGGKWGS
jgi:hypothetical protein